MKTNTPNIIQRDLHLTKHWPELKASELQQNCLKINVKQLTNISNKLFVFNYLLK